MVVIARAYSKRTRLFTAVKDDTETTYPRTLIRRGESSVFEFLVGRNFYNRSNANKNKQALEGLLDLLRQHIAKTYVPMLTLFENYLCEIDLKDKLKTEKPDCDLTTLIPKLHFLGQSGVTLSRDLVEQDEQSLTNFALGHNDIKPTPVGAIRTPLPMQERPADRFDNVFYSLLWSNINRPKAYKSLNILEKALTEVWADRLVWLFKKKSKKPVEDSLVFAKYLVGSPAMTKWVLEAAKVRHEKEESVPGEKKRRVRTTLVVGGPGSGKDAMAELISLFSPAFRLGAMEKMNMAMFRPKEAAVPLLLGIEVELDGKAHGVTGTLERVLKQHEIDRKPLVATDQPYSTRGSTFVFDELNSLDIDTQGALLRFIENADLKPLGGLKNPLDNFDALIVGVMNEDPQIITKRRVMDGVLRDKLVFGGILGEFLYEAFRAQRRLRDDLYFRFIRGGEILLPELRDRREDIPVLFYVNVDELLRQSGVADWEIDLSAYEELMDGSLRWEGNLRELQTVARQVVTVANEDFSERKRINDDASYLIMGIHVRQALAVVLRNTPARGDEAIN